MVKIKDSLFFRKEIRRRLDDLVLPDGSLSTSVTNFANEWRSDSSVRTTQCLFIHL
jgi:hypothetical protein